MIRTSITIPMVLTFRIDMDQDADHESFSVTCPVIMEI